MPIKVTPKKPANPGREGTKREPTQAEVDARRARMNEARMEAHKKNKTGPFRVIPGRQKGTTRPKDKRTFEKLRQPVSQSRSLVWSFDNASTH